MTKHGKKLLFSAVLTGCVSALISTGCHREKDSSHASKPLAPVHVNVKVSLDSAGIPGQATVTIVAIAKDFSLDTLVSFASPSGDLSSGPKILDSDFTFKPFKELKMIARLKDADERLVLKDSSIPGMLYPGDTVNVSLTLSTRTCMYQVAFPVIPDSIPSAVGAANQALHLNRLVMKVDGTVKVDSSPPSGSYFKSLARTMLYYDHMTMGNHMVELLAYGPMDSWDASKPLFSGSATFKVTPDLDPTTPIILAWTGPAPATGTLSAEVRKTDKVFFINSLSGTPAP